MTYYIYNRRQIKYLTDTQSVHHYKQLMRLIEQQSILPSIPLLVKKTDYDNEDKLGEDR
jgi:hypothetical protein